MSSKPKDSSESTLASSSSPALSLPGLPPMSSVSAPNLGAHHSSSSASGLGGASNATANRFSTTSSAQSSGSRAPSGLPSPSTSNPPSPAAGGGKRPGFKMNLAPRQLESMSVVSLTPCGAGQAQFGSHSGLRWDGGSGSFNPPPAQTAMSAQNFHRIADNNDNSNPMISLLGGGGANNNGNNSNSNSANASTTNVVPGNFAITASPGGRSFNNSNANNNNNVGFFGSNTSSPMPTSSGSALIAHHSSGSASGGGGGGTNGNGSNSGSTSGTTSNSGGLTSALSGSLMAPFHANEVWDGVYIGSIVDAQNPMVLRTLGIKRILNCATECDFAEAVKNAPQYFELKKINLRDNADEDIGKVFEDAFTFIDEAVARGDKVLVHCFVGSSRSPTIVISYIMQKLHQKAMALLPPPPPLSNGAGGGAGNDNNNNKALTTERHGGSGDWRDSARVSSVLNAIEGSTSVAGGGAPELEATKVFNSSQSLTGSYGSLSGEALKALKVGVLSPSSSSSQQQQQQQQGRSPRSNATSNSNNTSGTQNPPNPLSAVAGQKKAAAAALAVASPKQPKKGANISSSSDSDDADDPFSGAAASLNRTADEERESYYNRALDTVNAKREVVPNIGFVHALHKFEKRLRHEGQRAHCCKVGEAAALLKRNAELQLQQQQQQQQKQPVTSRPLSAQSDQGGILPFSRETTSAPGQQGSVMRPAISMTSTVSPGGAAGSNAPSPGAIGGSSTNSLTSSGLMATQSTQNMMTQQQQQQNQQQQQKQQSGNGNNGGFAHTSTPVPGQSVRLGGGANNKANGGDDSDDPFACC